MIKAASIFFVIAITILALIYGQTLLLPFVFSLLLWFIIRKLTHMLDKVHFFKYQLPYWLKSLLTMTLVLGTVTFISRILLMSTRSLTQSYEKYHANLDILLHRIDAAYKINIIELTKQYTTNLDFSLLFSGLLNALTDVLSNAFLILFYTLFI